MYEQHFSIHNYLFDDSEDSDEDKYVHVMRRSLSFKPFEEAKETYAKFAIQLIRSYEEIKKRSSELDYLYSAMFRFENLGKFDVTCDVVHLGFFYEIVLSDPSIMVRKM